MYPFRPLEAIEAGGSKNESVALSTGEFLEASVDVSPEIDKGHIGAQRKELGLAARAAGSDASVFRKRIERPVRLANPNVAGIGAFGNCGEDELWGESRGKVFEAMDGEINAALFKCFFNLFYKDALSIEVGRRDKTRLLHPVAGCADDLKFHVITGIAQSIQDVVGLPEGQLGASGPDADGIAGIVMLAAHILIRIRQDGRLQQIE